jgi:hypothetical protein
MATFELPAPRPWYPTRRFVVGALLVLGVVVAVEAYLAIFVRDNDFLVHRGFGQAFLAGEPLRAGQLHYLPSRGFLNGLTAWLPYRVDRALHFFTAVGLLALTFLLWHRVANGQYPLDDRRSFAAAVFTLVLVGSYVHRDLDDCGLQLFLLFFLTAGLWSLSRDRPIACGFWLGLATAYKVTPVLFLPFLLWKRKGQAAAWMAGFAVLANLAPVLYLGWEKTIACHRAWAVFSQQCMAMPDPSLNPLEPPRHLNQGLSVAIARYIQAYPPGHPLCLHHPWFVPTGWLGPAEAKRGVQVVLLAFAAVLAWRFRKRYRPAQKAELANEWAAVTMLCAILSPLCWLQHLVLIVPSVFLWVRAWLAGVPIPRWHWPVLAVFALIVLGVHREFVSRAMYEVLVAYKLHTLAALLAVLLVLTLPGQTANSASAQRRHTSAAEAKAA